MLTSRYWRYQGDLNRRNIIVSSFNPVQIVVVDWEQAGWYPDYWEYSKACFTCRYEDEWRKDFIDKVSQPRTDVYFVFFRLYPGDGRRLTLTFCRYYNKA
ncbi:hypothetical protein P175DRAFT_0499774 [Aspergillus ochraceoroseus IBT 24754]|uniref:Aminoglycoside phosphotransferase domain-containing protein n=1 Tax=Aspergillus ochraceoroseus IBT 24754 TaxID=1392256 RepID=A0A2T5M3W6_9EURO|nr:uncharacterized protein P175DRAFT_0499774 [Aspergillus ochraceoroseus IBT 24754]PTU23227.1 hypothetical protein P175DRAFT_0499774 [Aspergillus ochraceoroseus IBT 24754]